MVRFAGLDTDNVFIEHRNIFTGQPCPGIPQIPMEPVQIQRLENAEYSARQFSWKFYDARNTLYRHSMFAYPHFWLWHVMFDGTRLCRCWHSKEMKALQSSSPSTKED